MDDGKEELGIPQQGDECPEDKYLNKFVRDEVTAACLENLNKWRDLGIVLMGQSSAPSLDIIELDNRSVMKCCSAMFNLWRQRQPKANWNQLIRALKEVELFALAAQIETLLLPPVKQQGQEVMQQLHTELSDSVLKNMARELARIGDKWETLGSYLNIDKDILVKFHERDSKTPTIVYKMLKMWRNNTSDASLSNLEHIIDEFVSQQPAVAVSRSSSSSPATLSEHKKTLGKHHKHSETKSSPSRSVHSIRKSKQPTATVSRSLSSSSVSSHSNDHNTLQAPVITSHPQSNEILQGCYVVNLEVTAYGAMPLYYQWYYENDIVPGEIKSFYCIYPVTTRNAGRYFCQVENQYGVVNSAIATVIVTILPTARSPSLGSRFTHFPLTEKKSIDEFVRSQTKDFESKSFSLSQENVITDDDSSESLDATFSNFVDDILDVLAKEDFDRVQRRCLENLDVVGGISLSMGVKDKIDRSENLNDLVKVVSRCKQYWNWMNIRMLEKMAGNSKPAKQLIKEYKNKVFSRKIKDVMSEISDLEIPKNGYTEVKEKWKKNFNDLIVKDVVERWNEIEKKFKKEETMLLKSITEGCVEVCWLLPNHLVEDAICSATNNQPSRRDDDDQSDPGSTQQLFPEMLYLKIGDIVIKDDFMSELNTKYVELTVK